MKSQFPTSIFLLIFSATLSHGQNMGQFAALPWSLLWLNPSYTGFYGGLGNVGQLTPDSAYLSGMGGQSGGQFGGRGGGYNYGLGAYNATSRNSIDLSVFFSLLSVLFLQRLLIR